jgi:RNA polymerase sigma-70 factor, ECF subfamily
MNSVNQDVNQGLHTLQQASATSEIVSEVLAGSHKAFAELHATYSRRLYKTIVAITRDSQDAEDALQDTFMRAHLAIDTFEGRSNIYSWLTRIAINSALMILRRKRARPEILFDPQPSASSDTAAFQVKDPALNPEEAYHQRERRTALLLAIRNLDPHLRRPLQMQMSKGASVREISRALNISKAAVKTRLHRARLRLSAPCRRPFDHGTQKVHAAKEEPVRERTATMNRLINCIAKMRLFQGMSTSTSCEVQW